MCARRENLVLTCCVDLFKRELLLNVPVTNKTSFIGRCSSLGSVLYINYWNSRKRKRGKLINEGIWLTSTGHGGSIVFCSEKAWITGARSGTFPDGKTMRWALGTGNICWEGFVVSNLACLERWKGKKRLVG